MRLILTYSWSADMMYGTDIYPVIHDSPEAAYVDFCESYSKFRAELEHIESQRSVLSWSEFYELYGAKIAYYFKWKDIEFSDPVDLNGINFQTVDEFFAKVESSKN